MAFLCVSQHGEFKNTTKSALGKVHAKNFLPKKIEGGKPFSCRFPLQFFLIAFLAVSLHDGLKNTTRTFPEIRPGTENLEDSPKKKYHGTYLQPTSLPSPPLLRS
jgi:hypothetical protein